MPQLKLNVFMLTSCLYLRIILIYCDLAVAGHELCFCSCNEIYLCASGKKVTKNAKYANRKTSDSILKAIQDRNIRKSHIVGKQWSFCKLSLHECHSKYVWSDINKCSPPVAVTAGFAGANLISQGEVSLVVKEEGGPHYAQL